MISLKSIVLTHRLLEYFHRLSRLRPLYPPNCHQSGPIPR